MLTLEQESQTGIVVPNECDEGDIACLLDILYTGAADLAKYFPDLASNLFIVSMKLYEIADYFQVDSILDILKENLDAHPDTVIRRLCRVGQAAPRGQVQAQLIDAIRTLYDNHGDREDMISFFRESLSTTTLGCLPVIPSPKTPCRQYPDLFEGFENVVSKLCELKKLQWDGVPVDGKCDHCEKYLADTPDAEPVIIDVFVWIQTNKFCASCVECFNIVDLKDWRMVTEHSNRPVARTVRNRVLAERGRLAEKAREHLFRRYQREVRILWRMICSHMSP